MLRSPPAKLREHGCFSLCFPLVTDVKRQQTLANGLEDKR